MATVPGASRAKRAYLKTRKVDKAGRSYIGQNEVIVSHGMFSAREAERELQKAADAAEEEVVGMAVETDDGRSSRFDQFDGNPQRGSRSGTRFGGFQGAAWLDESPELRRRRARREQG